MDAINSLESAREMTDANDAIFALISPPADTAEETPTDDSRGELDVKGCFAGMQDAFKAEAAEGVDVVFQFSISGQGGGEWSCVIKDKTCTIEAGTHEKPICTLKMADNDFLDMMTGKLPAMQAYTSGKLQIEGDILKSQLIEKLFTI
jgi:putative sterol carrier protein